MRTAIWVFADGQWSSPPEPSFDDARTLILVFASPHYRAENWVLQELNRTFGSSIVMGCSTAGEIAGAELLHDSVTVLALRFECTEIRGASVSLVDFDGAYEAGSALTRQLASSGLRGMFLLSDGLRVNGSQLVDGVNAVLPSDAVLTGALAGDEDRFENTWVFSEGQIATGRIAAVGFYGDAVELYHGYGGGWGILGIEREVTRADRNTLYELDGQPALALYKRYLGDLSASLPASGLLFPLAILDENGEEAYVRTILGVDEAEQSIVFAGDIPEGSIVTLTSAGNDDLVEGADRAARCLMLNAAKNAWPAACIAISCVGRRMVMKQVTEDELETVMHRLPPDAAMAGFYSYGEIAPHNGGYAALHNQTMTLTLIREKPCTGC